MIKIIDNINKIEEILSFFERPISLCGQATDFFLLKNNELEVKDLDFVTQDYSIIQEYKNKFFYCVTNTYGESLYTKEINNINIDIFYSEKFNYEQDSYPLQEYKIRCETPAHRFNFLKNMLNNPKVYYKNQNKLQKIVNNYREFYNFD